MSRKSATANRNHPNQTTTSMQPPKISTRQHIASWEARTYPTRTIARWPRHHDDPIRPRHKRRAQEQVRAVFLFIYNIYPHLLYPQFSHFMQPSAIMSMLPQVAHTGALPRLAME